jgi:hypothetical protein
MPYVCSSDVSKLLPAQFLENAAAAIPSYSSPVVLALLVALTEVTPWGLLIGCGQTVAYLESAPPIFTELVRMLVRAQFPRSRICYRESPPDKVTYFANGNRIYGVEEKAELECVITIRDQYGTSVLSVEELLTSRDRMPCIVPMAAAELHLKHPEAIHIDLEQGSLVVSVPPVHDLTIITDEISLPPFGPGRRRRPVAVDIIRALNLIGDETVIMASSTDFQARLEDLDRMDSLGKFTVTVYSTRTVDQKIADDWSTNVVPQFLSAFATHGAEEHTFITSMSAVQVMFVPPAAMKGASFSIIVNPSGLPIKDVVTKSLFAPTVISVSPLGPSMFKIVNEKHGRKVMLAFGKDVVVPEKLLKGYICYLALSQLLSDDPTVFTTGVESRMAKLKQVIDEAHKVSMAELLSV